MIITPDLHGKVLDFGLARLRETRDDAATVLKTAPGVAMRRAGLCRRFSLNGRKSLAPGSTFPIT